ncbi:MAG: zinc ribbon domain-containing protein [Eubacteriales bacterium]|nr:zinc ribbon domain-containing protein [Eubacteriales bacterium]
MKCKNCGETINKDEIYCPVCGSKAGDDTAPRVSKARAVVIVFAALLSVAVVLLLLDTAGIAVFSDSGNTDYSEQTYQEMASRNYLEVVGADGGQSDEILIYGGAGDANWQISFDGAMSESDVRDAVSAQDAVGQAIALHFEFNDSEADISIPEEDIVPGMPYTVTLGDGVNFIKSELQYARMITFIPEREDTQIIEYQDNVVELDGTDANIGDEGTLTLTGDQQLDEGDIIILSAEGENGLPEQTAYKVDSVSEDGRIETSEPAIEEIFEQLDISGTYQMDPGGFVLDEEAIELQVRQSSFFDCLVRTAYAGAADKDKIAISVQLMPSENQMLNIRVKISLKDAFKNNSYLTDLNFYIDIGYKADVRLNVIARSVFDVTCNSATVIHFSIGPAGGVTTGPPSDYSQFDAEDFMQALDDELENSDQDTIMLGTVPFATAGIVSVTADLEAFFNFSISGGFNLDSGIQYYNKSGAIISKDYVKPYSTDEFKSGVENISGIFKLNEKGGIRVSLLASILKAASAGFEFDVGEYGELAGAFAFKGGDYDTLTDRFFGYAEVGLYCELSFVAKVNFFKPIKAEFLLIPSKKLPILQGGKRENIGSIRAPESMAYIDAYGSAVMPEILATYYDVFDGTYEEREVAYGDLTYTCSDAVDYNIDSDGNIQFYGDIPGQFEMTVCHKDSTANTAVITMINTYAEPAVEETYEETYEEPFEPPVEVTDDQQPDTQTAASQPYESPSAVVQRYYNAVLDGDFTTALTYLTPEYAQSTQDYISYMEQYMDQIMSAMQNSTPFDYSSYDYRSYLDFTVTDEQINGDTAIVYIDMTYLLIDFTMPMYASCEIIDGQWRVASEGYNYSY